MIHYPAAQKAKIPHRASAQQQVSTTPPPPTMYEIDMDDGTTWRGTERELRALPRDWQPLARAIPPSQPLTSLNEEDDGAYEDDVWPVRVPSSARRLQQGTCFDGNTKLNVHYAAPPPPTINKKGRTVRNTEEPQTQQGSKRQRRLHLLRGLHPWVHLGVGMLLMLTLWVGLTSLVSWVQLKMNDINFGMPRTYQFDAVVGHNGDSAANPTHFIILNLNRKIEVIELPAQDATKAQIFIGPTLIDPGSELFPVTAYVKDVNGDGKPDLVLTIQDSHFILINTGIGFRPLKPGEHVSM